MNTLKPNILFIITDQHRADHLGCYGNKVVQTPHIDSIAAKGLSFDKFYVACPICMPNRATLMTGRMPSVNGVLTNGLSLPWDSNTFVHLLKNSGYNTSLIGKSHLQNNHPLRIEDWNYPPVREGAAPPEGYANAHLSDRFSEIYENERSDLWLENVDKKVNYPYYGFENVQLTTGHGDRIGGHYRKWVIDRYKDFDNLIGPENALPSSEYIAPQAWRTAVPEELYSTEYVAENTIKFLGDYAKSSKEKPFFVQCSFPDPHHPFVPPGKYWGMYDPGDCKVSKSLGCDLSDPPPFQKALQEQFATGKRESRVAAYACDEREARESTALTYGMISCVDDAVGRILAELKVAGLDRNTVIIFTSDHGDLMGDHGLMLKHCFHNEGLIRVPFIWSDPDQSFAGHRTDLISGTIDISASILARVGLAPYHGMQGFDCISAVVKNEKLPRLGIVVEEDEIPFNANCGHFMRTRSFVTERWRLTYWMEHEFGELYDHYNDPAEVNNLWKDSSAASDKALLLEMLMHERIALDDMSPKALYCA